MSHAARIVCATLGVLVAACADAPELGVSSVRQAVSGGEISGADENFVVRVVSRQPGPYYDLSCSGVLLAPNLLATALHCVTIFDGFGEFSCRPDGSLAPGTNGGWIGETLMPEAIEVYFGSSLPLEVGAYGTSVLGSGSTQMCVDDIAFVVLDTQLPVQRVPVRLTRPVVEGERMTVIGTGLNDWSDVVRARRSDVPVLDVGPDDTSEGAGTAAPRSFIVGDGPCSGDSGGPALSDETGAVTGLFSYNFSGDCRLPGTRASFTKLAPYASLLRRAFDAAGQAPKVEGEPDPPAPQSSGASCALGAQHGRPGFFAPALSGLVALFALRRRARARTLETAG